MGFVHNAIQFQQSAETIAQARKSLDISCRMCSEKGLLHYDCDACPVQLAHNTRLETMKAIDLLNSEKERLT